MDRTWWDVSQTHQKEYPIYYQSSQHIVTQTEQWLSSPNHHDPTQHFTSTIQLSITLTSFLLPPMEVPTRPQALNKIYLKKHTVINNKLRIIPCQINQEFRVASQILTKLDVLWWSYHPYKFLAPHASWFLIYDHKHFGYFSPSPFTKLTVTFYCTNVLTNRTVDWPFFKVIHKLWDINF